MANDTLRAEDDVELEDYEDDETDEDCDDEDGGDESDGGDGEPVAASLDGLGLMARPMRDTPASPYRKPRNMSRRLKRPSAKREAALIKRVKKKAKAEAKRTRKANAKLWKKYGKGSRKFKYAPGPGHASVSLGNLAATLSQAMNGGLAAAAPTLAGLAASLPGGAGLPEMAARLAPQLGDIAASLPGGLPASQIADALAGAGITRR